VVTPSPVSGIYIRAGGPQGELENGTTEETKMQLVYATGHRERDFHIAARREEVPTDARVYATCTQESTVEQVGEVTFQNMSDEEFYALKAMVREARQRAMSEQSAGSERTGTLRGLFSKLFNR
jgi:hypothetical protein